MNESTDSLSSYKDSDSSSVSSEESSAVQKNSTGVSRKLSEEKMDVSSKETIATYKEKTHFVTRGWETYDLLLGKQAMTQARKFLTQTKNRVFSDDKKKSCSIFQRVFVGSGEKEKDAKKRFQYVFNRKKELENQAWFKKFKKNLNKFLRQKGDGCVLQECVLLYSEDGCEKQENHRDFSLYNTHYMAGIFSFDENSDTFLNIEDNDVVQAEDTTQSKYSDQTTKVPIPVGQVLLFRGDAIHSGSAYEKKSNLRLYFKSYPNGVRLPKDNRYYVNMDVHSNKKELVKCAKCGKKEFANKYQVSKHQMTDCVGLTQGEREKMKNNYQKKACDRKRKHRERQKEELEKSKEELQAIALGVGSKDQTQEEHTTARVTRSKRSNMNL